MRDAVAAVVGSAGDDSARARLRITVTSGVGPFGSERGDGSTTFAGGEDRLVDDRDAVRAFEEAWALEMLNAAQRKAIDELCISRMRRSQNSNCFNFRKIKNNSAKAEEKRSTFAL